MSTSRNAVPQTAARSGRSVPPYRVASEGQERVARWTVLIYSVASVATLAAWPLGRFSSGQGWVDVAGDVLNLPLAYGLFGSLLMFLVTGSLLRRKRFGLWIVLILQMLGVLLALGLLIRTRGHVRMPALRGLELDTGAQITTYAGAVFGLLAIGLLWWARAAFPARRSPGSRWAALVTLVSGMLVSIALAIILAEAYDGSLKHPFMPVVQGTRAALGLNSIFPRDPNVAHLPNWITSLTSTVSAIVLLAAVAVFLRSGRTRLTIEGSTELAIRKLLLGGGHDDSLGYFATRRDKTVMISPDGRAAISYRVIASVALASADPLGPKDAWPGAINAWLAQARTYGWVPAALSPGREAAQAYVDAGLRAIPLGDEAIVDTSTFTLAGPAMKAVRQAVVRVQRAGYTVSIRRHRDIEPAEMAQLADCAEAWRGDAPERGFSMALSRLGDPADGSCLMVVAHRPDGEPAGLLSLVPWGRRGVSLDLMRRDREGINGLVEMMVTTLIERKAEFGLRRISLNFAMFRAVFAEAEEFGAGPVTKLNNAVLGVFSRFFQLESLYRSNAKYRPSWVPRYLCIDSPLSLIRVSIAAGVAEGFLPSVTRRERLTSLPAAPWLVKAIADAEEQAATVRPAALRRPREQERIRRDRLGILAAAGMEAYPVSVPRTGTLPDVLAHPDGAVVSATGRVEALRDFGGVSFGVIAGESTSLQLLLSCLQTRESSLKLWRAAVDRGDIVSATGTLGYSRSGERSLIVTDWQMASKSLKPLPSSRTGLTDPEARVRNRSVDLIVNPDSLAILATRSVAVGALRTAFWARGFGEVETPILQNVHGGATARPFTTHINAYDRNLSLRIAPELFLKRLIVGGTGPIFEMGRNFRNEGADATHNPEFTSLEAYLPFADYHRMREITTDVIREVATAVYGSPIAMRPDKSGILEAVDLSAPWGVMTVHDAVSKACGVPIDAGTSTEELQLIALANRVVAPDGMSAGEIVMDLYDHLVEPTTFLPTFYLDFPVETSPLTRTHRTDPRLSERWDLVAFGMEIGTAYSELVDPIDQRARLTEQSLRAAAGDEEAMEIDEDFLGAMELGMPPTGGLGLGVDRVVMMLTGTPIRSVLTFPFVRPLT
ncbi:bifunctional lysylphosphatidylglycerol synthetase/lysine--tRNA ligase LysX [Nakamurella sp. PAMC28650]|uniref:bifunctional lysylphosphatidylglycerol synthetase/lysine--tRNA ligase LysX n=1 Tax=Nakamurella sp. PAMC28650 TaxID=2762325 RepID=UPI001C9AA1AA|nr:bifunctional lysylphosphatidylglycerol synthetase/lysine--tRNA ligase LysX [Nakamurella sp. PAMC28650]